MTATALGLGPEKHFATTQRLVEYAGSARLVGNNGMAEGVPLALAPCSRRSSTPAYKNRRG